MKYIGPLTEKHARIIEEHLKKRKYDNFQKFLGMPECSETMEIRNNSNRTGDLIERYHKKSQ